MPREFRKYIAIDFHVNIGTDASNIRTNLIPTGQGFQELLAKMEKFGIDKAVILPFPSPRRQFSKEGFWYDYENNLIINAYRFAPKQLVPFVAVNPCDNESVANVKTLIGLHPIKGVKLSHQPPMLFSIEQLIGNPLMKIIRDSGVPLMIHIGTGRERDAGKFHTTLNYAVKVAKEHPDIKFVFAHLGRLHWSMLEALTLENVWFDTSGLSMWKAWMEFIAEEPLRIFKVSTPPEVIERLVELGWERKLLFGSDEPYVHYPEELGYITQSGIGEGAKRNILSGNAEKLLK